MPDLLVAVGFAALEGKHGQRMRSFVWQDDVFVVVFEDGSEFKIFDEYDRKRARPKFSEMTYVPDAGNVFFGLKYRAYLHGHEVWHFLVDDDYVGLFFEGSTVGSVICLCTEGNVSEAALLVEGPPRRTHRDQLVAEIEQNKKEILRARGNEEGLPRVLADVVLEMLDRQAKIVKCIDRRNPDHFE